jgi:hypothetical protein
MRSDWSVDWTSHLGFFAFSRSDFVARYRPYDPHNRTRCKSYQRERRYKRTRKIGAVGERHWNMKWGKKTRKRNWIHRTKFNKQAMYVYLWRLRWSSGSHAGLWFPSSRVQTRPKPLDFSVQKILSMPYKLSFPCPNFAACKRTSHLQWITKCELNSFDKSSLLRQ